MKHVVSKILVVCSLVSVFSCKTYSTHTNLNRGKLLKNITSAGILLRLPMNPRITRSELQENVSQWISPVRQLKKTIIVGQCDDAVCIYTGTNRFFQLSDDNKTFLDFKSRGVIHLYLRQNEAKLKEIMANNSFDGIIIYEVYPLLSYEMQFIDFDSVLCIVDRELNIVFMDHQFNRFENDEINIEKMKKNLMDKISERLLLSLESLSFVKR